MTDLPIFVAASIVLIVTPGPDVLYVVARGVAQGRRAGLLSATGVTAGLLVHTVFAALGLAVLLQTSTLAFMIVKYVGALYLFYLGIRTFRDKAAFTPMASYENASAHRIFWQGVLSNVLNPKVGLFFMAFLPQFVDATGARAELDMIGLGVLFASMGLVFLCAVGYSAGRMGSWLQRRQGFTARLRWITGSVFILLGARLVGMEQK